MSKDILIIDTPYVSLESNNRSIYIPKLLASNGHKVEKVSSNFNHFTKEFINSNNIKYGFKITTLNTIGYKKNLSFSRFMSQKIFAYRLGKYLKMRNIPDTIYLFVPSLDVGNVVVKYAKKNRVKLIIDVRDLWPEAFKMIVKNNTLYRLLFAYQIKLANNIYRNANEIVAVSDTYKERATLVNKLTNGHTIYLGTDIKEFDSKLEGKRKKNNEIIQLAYVGTLSHSYDLNTAIDAINILKDRGYNNLVLNVYGNGPLENNFREYADRYKVNVNFTGRLSYKELVNSLYQCDIALNPIVKGAAQSIINKHADYAAAGLPVVNSQECAEYRRLIEEFNIGLNCDNSNSLDMADKIEKLIIDESNRIKMGKNHRKLAEDRFDRAKTYKKILEII